MTDPKRAAEFAAEFAAIPKVPGQEPTPLAAFGRWQKAIAAFMMNPEKQRWYEETHGPYLPLDDAPPSPSRAAPPSPYPQDLAVRLAAEIRRFPRHLNREVMLELAEDFERMLAAAGGRITWED